MRRGADYTTGMVLSRGIVAIAWHGRFRGLEAVAGVRPIAKRFRAGAATSAERKPNAIDRSVFGAVPIHDSHVFAFDDVRTIRANGNSDHGCLPFGSYATASAGLPRPGAR